MYIVDQLSRLHMILKPFMLRRIKKDVENEMADKVGGVLVGVANKWHMHIQIEIQLSCGLSKRQKELYHRLRDRISIDELLHSNSSTTKDSSTSTLMNLVMQFRKVH